MANQIITNLITTRKSKDDSFLPDYTPEELKSYTIYTTKTYINSGKILERTQSMSMDGLTRTVITVWVDDESRQQYLSDPIVAKRLSEIVEYFKINDGFDVKCINQEVSNGEVIREWQVDY